MLKAEQDACRKLLQRLAVRLTGPSEKEGWQPIHKFTLRGVSTSADITYVCKQDEPDLIELEQEDEASPSSRDQWWRLAYLPQASEPVVVEVSALESGIVRALTDVD